MLLDLMRSTMEAGYEYFGQQSKLQYLNLDENGNRTWKLYKELRVIKIRPERDDFRYLLTDLYYSIYNVGDFDKYLYEREKNRQPPFLFHIPFKSPYLLTNKDIEEVNSQFTLIECIERSVIAGYEMFGMKHKLVYLNQFDEMVKSLPSADQILAVSGKALYLLRLVYKLQSIERLGRASSSIVINKWFGRPLINKNEKPVIKVMDSIQIVYNAYIDLGIPVPEDFVELCKRTITSRV